MDVRLLYFDGCPNWRDADKLLRQAMQAAGIEDELLYETVTSAEQAEQLSFRGSPTVLIDGRDPFAEPDAPVGLSCRVFVTPEGLRGSPTLEQLVEVLTAPGGAG